MGRAFIHHAFVLAAIAIAFVVPARADDTTVPKGLAPSDWSSIRAAYEAHRHAIVADESTPGHYRARNPGQQWITTFDGRGFSTSPDARTDSAFDGGGWTWGLDLVSYGRGEAQRAIDGTACIQTKGTRVEYEWNHALTEWYINDQRGLEHGYTVRERPEGADGPNGSGDGMLHFTLAVRGGLVPRVSENGRDVTFATAADGGAAVNYNGLKVFDADGVHLAASFQTVTTAAGTPALRLTIDDTNARYPLTIDPTAQQAYLKASNTGAYDYFGWSVAVSGDTVVVGAFREAGSINAVSSAGAAYVFVRDPTTLVWTQQAYLKASNADELKPFQSDAFGYSVAVSGDTVVVGAREEDSRATGVNGNQADNSFPDSGAAYVFVRNAGVWTQQAYLKASNTGADDQFGYSVAVSGNTVVVGAPREASIATGVNGNQANNSAYAAGAAYVFVRSGTTWTHQAYLKASNTESLDEFGCSVAVSGDTVVVGAYGEDSNATGVNGNQTNNSGFDSGAAYVFTRSTGVWTQQAYLKGSNIDLNDYFGYSVAVSGDTVVVGAYNATVSGEAHVFFRSGSTWTQQAYLKASNAGVGDFFGYSVAVSGDTVVVGACQEAGGSSAFRSGAAYVFVRNPTTLGWTQQAYLKASNTGGSDFFGWSVAVSGDTFVVGAYCEDSNATGVNGNQADNSATDSGAVYTFVLGLPTPSSPLASPASVCPGDPAALSVSDPGAGIVIDWFTGSCGGTLLGTGNPFNVTPAATTTYYARARRTSDGNTSDACASVVVAVEQCCPADFNGDGFLDFTDFDGFVIAFEAGDTSGDFNGDGFIDFTDFDAFVSAFEAGC